MIEQIINSYSPNNNLPKSNLLNFSRYLEERILMELPGHSAHLTMSPVKGNLPFRGFKPTPDARSSAVLILLTEIDNAVNILFTLRSKTLNSHSGQISFPGGRIEENETLEQAALRETMEEVNIPEERIRLIGKLSPLFVPPSNSIIYPFVGLTDIDSDDVIVNPDEVDEVFFVPINSFFNSEFMKTEKWDFKGIAVDVPFWNVHYSTPLWGATAMILSELLLISQEYFETNKI